MTIKIRSSILPSYFDCARRGATRIITQLITDAGYELRKLDQNVGAAVGTGVHASAEYAMRLKIEECEPAYNDVIEVGIVKVKEGLSNGITYDTTTPDKNTAEKQLQQIATSFYYDVMPKVNPVGTEIYRKAIIAEGYELTGHDDIETDDNKIIDWKTSKRPYHAQMGSYSLLKKSNENQTPSGLSMWHLPRVSIKKTFPGCTEIPYDIPTCERAAFACVKHIIRDIENFKTSQNPFVFACNPMSMLCSEKFCGAYKTAWCELTL